MLYCNRMSKSASFVCEAVHMHSKLQRTESARLRAKNIPGPHIPPIGSRPCVDVHHHSHQRPQPAHCSRLRWPQCKRRLPAALRSYINSSPFLPTHTTSSAQHVNQAVCVLSRWSASLFTPLNAYMHPTPQHSSPCPAGLSHGVYCHSVPALTPAHPRPEHSPRRQCLLSIWTISPPNSPSRTLLRHGGARAADT